LLIALNIIAAAVKAIAGRWNTGTASCHILYQIISAAVSISFLSSRIS
jgi:hypothetical protein